MKEIHDDIFLTIETADDSCDTDDDDDENNLHRTKLDAIVETKKDEYVNSFTVHGLTRIFKGSKSESIFWMLMLLVGVTLSTYIIHGLIRKYFEYNIYTEVRSNVSFKNIFPGITLCEFNGMLSNYFAYCGQQKGQKFKNPDDVCTMDASALGVAATNVQEINNTLSHPYQWSNGLFHVTHCHTWGGKYCANDQYLRSLKDHNHHCFTFNHRGDFHDTYAHAYIEFTLNDTLLKHDPPFIIAVVHDPKIAELDMTNRVVIEDSNIYELKIDKTLIKRLPDPFPSNCTYGKSHDFFPGKYTRRNCLESITYARMYMECGGVLDYHRKFIPEELKEKYGKSNKSISEMVRCIEQFSQKEVTDIKECPFPCEEIEYTTMPTFHSQSPKDDPKPTFRLHIQYHRVDSYKSIEEKQLVTWDQVAGEVGGLVGLVIGASFISIIEIVFYFFLCSFHKLKACLE